MKENFKRSAAFVLKQEVDPGHEHDGSLHTDPADPGGTTRFGISQRAYPKIDPAKLDYDGAMKIYAEIWKTADCDTLPWPLDIIVFDTAFNMGDIRAKRILAMGSDYTIYLFHRLLVYYFMKPRYFRDWVKRVLNLWQEITK